MGLGFGCEVVRIEDRIFFHNDGLYFDTLFANIFMWWKVQDIVVMRGDQKSRVIKLCERWCAPPCWEFRDSSGPSDALYAYQFSVGDFLFFSVDDDIASTAFIMQELIRKSYVHHQVSVHLQQFCWQSARRSSFVSEHIEQYANDVRKKTWNWLDQNPGTPLRFSLSVEEPEFV